MKNNLTLTICLLVIFGISGCVTLSPLATHFENNFQELNPIDKDIVKASDFKKNFEVSYDEAWNNVLYILSQYAIITDASKELGYLTYIDIDGLYFEDVYTRHKFSYWEFPFTVYIEKEPTGVGFYIYPMKDIYKKYSTRWWWKSVEAAFDQKSEEFRVKLSTQMAAKSRWRWLNSSSE
jgi:hypothetical protein